MQTCRRNLWAYVQVVQGLIWVWGDNGRDAGLESALTPAVLVPELNDAEALESGRVIALSYYHRDLPYAWETCMENGVVSCVGFATVTGAAIAAGALVRVPFA